MVEVGAEGRRVLGRNELANSCWNKPSARLRYGQCKRAPNSHDQVTDRSGDESEWQMPSSTGWRVRRRHADHLHQARRARSVKFVSLAEPWANTNNPASSSC